MTVLSLAQIQSEVLTAVCDVHKPVPPYIEFVHDEARRNLRFDIYRNNFYAAVINVLRERFPVTERIVGEDFFKATARTFVGKTPPKGQSNLGYGQDFAQFLSTFPPAADLPYLPDIARLEWMRFQAAIAPDAPVVTSQDFARIDRARAALVQFELHPSCRTMVSQYPVYDIWRTNHEDDEVQSLRDSRDGQAVLVARNQNGVEVHNIGTDSAALVEQLAGQTPLGQAYENVSTQLPQQEFSNTLALLLASGAITRLNVPDLADIAVDDT